jgi:arylsulfatase A-like enzyme
MAAIKKIDDATGMILNALENLDLDEKTTVLITTDHGVDTGSHALTDENSVWMITNEQGYCQAGDQKDIVPTILKRMGLEYTNIKPAYPGKSLF